MKSLIVYFGLVISFICLLASCGMQPKLQDEITIVDSLENEVKEIEKEFEAIDVSKAEGIYEDVTSNLDESMKLLENSATNEQGRYISNYANITKAFKKMSFKVAKLSKEIAFTKDQLKNLKQDLENDLLEKEVAQKYIQEEREAIETLRESVDEFSNGLDYAYNTYNKLTPDFVNFIDSLKTVKGIAE